MQFTYIKTPLYRYTFQSKSIREWVEAHVEGKVLNLFAGKTILNCDEVRNDLNIEMPADYHFDALEFVRDRKCEKFCEKFGTVLLDPPYSLRKCMTKYKGVITSPFNQLKNEIVDVLIGRGIVITFGYQSVSMGEKRGFSQEHLLLMSHGGAIHDTIAIKERSIRLY